jgi:hypothetical protein
MRKMILEPTGLAQRVEGLASSTKLSWRRKIWPGLLKEHND